MTQTPVTQTSIDSSKAESPIDWVSVFAEHEKWLRTVIYARVGDREGAEEVLQEVALAAVKQSAPIEDRAKIAPWLYQVAIRQTLLYRRKMGRMRKLKNGFAEKTQPTEEDHRTDNPLTWLIDNERRELVREAIKQLRKQDREILLLKYTEGWNYNQISTHLGISQSAVEARLHRARQKLRNLLVSNNVVEVRNRKPPK